MSMKPLTATFFAAVRLANGNSWMDSASVRVLPDMAQAAADKADRSLPVWAKDNPVQRIARFDAVESDEDAP